MDRDLYALRQIDEQRIHEAGDVVEIDECPECSHSGKVNPECESCGGRGWIKVYDPHASPYPTRADYDAFNEGAYDPYE